MNAAPNRTAMTLVELLFAMFVATILTGTLAVVMFRVLSSEDSTARHLETIVALSQLGEQLRSDAHAASDARVEPLDGQPRVLHLDLPDGKTVQYTIDDCGADRLAERAGQVVSRERFTLAEMRCLAWQDEIASSRRVSLVIGRLARQGDDPTAVKSKFTIAGSLPPAAKQVHP